MEAPALTRERPRLAVVPPPPPAADPLERLFREHNGLVWRVARRVTGSDADAEDVLQTVFLRLARREIELDPDAAPERYLARAASNAALDVIRSRGVRAAETLDDVHPADPLASPERQQIGRQIRDRLREALGRLHPKTAEVFVLRHFEGYGNREIAEIVGSSPASVAVTLFRAKALLRRELGRTMGESR